MGIRKSSLALTIMTVGAAIVTGCSQVFTDISQGYLTNSEKSNFKLSFSKDESRAFDLLMKNAKEKADNGNPQGSISDLNKAIEIAPQFPLLYFRIGQAKIDLKDPKEAISYFTKAIDMNPRYTLAYINRASQKYQLGDLEEAISDLNLALEKGIRQKLYTPLIYESRGIIKEHLNNYNGARSDFQKLTELEPKNPNSFITLGNFYLRMGKLYKEKSFIDSACKRYKIAIPLGGKIPDNAKKECAIQ